MSTRFLHIDSILVRTEDGTAKMRARSSDLTPKLRSVLFLIDGRHSFGQLLDRAGALSGLLESQIRELVELKMVSVVNNDEGGRDLDHPESTKPSGVRARPKVEDIPPVVAAKMQLMLRLEQTTSADIDILGAELLEAKTLKELAYTAKSITNRLSMSVGLERSQRFWREAKEILTAWRDISARTEEANP